MMILLAHYSLIVCTQCHCECFPRMTHQSFHPHSCGNRHNDSVLEDKDCENIYELVYCTHRPLAQAAGEFLTLKLFEVDSHAPPTKTKKGKRRSENTPLIRYLVQFFIESEVRLDLERARMCVCVYKRECLRFIKLVTNLYHSAYL